jgi:hypothetical protein
LNELRQQVDEQLQMFSNLRVEIAAEKERLEKLRVEREEELKSISSYKLELEVERRAVILVRFVCLQNLQIFFQILLLPLLCMQDSDFISLK